MRVLVVDDDPDIRQVVQACLFDATVLVAADGPGALDLLEREVVDLVLLDVMLPGMDGLTVLDCIRQQPDLDDTAVVMLTAQAGESGHLAAFRRGADGYLTKPFDVDALLDTVEAVLARDQQAREAVRADELARASLLHSLEQQFGL